MNNHSGIKTAILFSLIFFMFGLLIISDFGETYDERESYLTGFENIHVIGNFFRGEPVKWPEHHILPGYQFVFDTVRSMTGLALNYLIGDKESIYGFHFFNLLIASLILLITFLIGRDISAEPAIGWLAAVTLALHPKFIAHSQANPKDMIGVFVIMFSVWIMTRTAQSNNWRTSIYLAISMGFALASHIASVILYPLTGVWLLITNKQENKYFFIRMTVVFLVSLLVAFFCWPWLWAHPYNRTLDIIHNINISESANVLYLGQFYDLHFLPWHYSLVSVMAATPSFFIITAAAGIVRLKERNQNTRQLIVLSLLLMSIIFIAEITGSAHYDGVRHVLAALPALALLSGCGLHWIGNGIWQLFSNHRNFAAAACSIVIAAAFISIPVQLLRLHPYYDAYLNEGIRMAIGSHAENTFELEYWCFTYKEASKWLNKDAPHGSVVITPMASYAMKPLLRKDLQLTDAKTWNHSYKGPCYMVIMTRSALYNELIFDIRAIRQPVFTITRQNSVLLEIYRFDL